MDGGQTWKDITPLGNELLFLSVHFSDPLTGWVVGNYHPIMKTIDGGQSWKKQNIGIGNTIRSVRFIDNQTGWAVGDEGAVFKTTNGGDVWTKEVIETKNHLFFVFFTDKEQGWIVGGGGTILHLKDCTPVSSSSVPIDNSIKLFPNPAFDYFQVQTGERFQVTDNTFFVLHDLTGRRVLQQAISSSNFQVMRSFLPPGIYLYSIVKNNLLEACGKVVFTD